MEIEGGLYLAPFRGILVHYLVLAFILQCQWAKGQPDLFESFALLQLKADNGPAADGVSSWQFGVNHCTGWKGVKCWNNGRVEWLRLRAAGLNGTLSRAVGLLPQLRQLDLRDNHLSGGIPPELTFAPNLQTLTLQGNRLSGPVPDFLRNMSHLDELGLGHNKFKGPLPRNMFTTMRSLQLVDLGHNELSGAIPDNLVDIPTLRVLLLQSNSFSGPVSPLLASSPSLFAVNLSNNLLSGLLPSMWTLTNITSLDFSSNLLQGEIPLSLLGLSNLTKLNLANNNFSGVIPQQLACKFGDAAFEANPHLLVDWCRSPSEPPLAGSERSSLDSGTGEKSTRGAPLSTLAIVALIVGDIALLIVSLAGFFILYLWWKRHTGGVSMEREKDDGISVDEGSYGSTQRLVYGKEPGEEGDPHRPIYMQ